VKAQAKSQVDSSLILSSQVAQALSVIGDRWALLIIRDVYLGVRHFEDLRKRIGAARGTLASRLKSLVKRGILYKEPYQDSPVRYDYRLTEKGLDLYPMVAMIWAWDHNWGKHVDLPRSLFHKSCDSEMVPIYRCKCCKEKVRPQDIRFSPGDDFAKAKKVAPRFQRRSKSKREKNGDFGKNDVSAVDCMGDRWTSLVLAAGFFAAAFLAAGFLAVLRLPLPLVAALASISSTACSMVTVSGSTSLGSVALTFSHLT